MTMDTEFSDVTAPYLLSVKAILTDGHQNCIIGASDVIAETDSDLWFDLQGGSK